MDLLIDSKRAGSRYASRVRIASPGGSAFDGRVGTVVSIVDGSVMVRLDSRSLSSIVLPFGRSDLKVIAR